MKEFPHASLAYLTEPVPGQAVLNVQVESGELVRAVINKQQLKRLIYEAARIEYGYVEARA